MNISQGPHYIDDLLTFSVTTHRFDTGALTDADSVPSYRVYEDETGTAILTGSMAKLDDANTTGFYSEQITLSAANGFEAGKTYSVYVTAAVNSVTGGLSGSFRLSGVHPANVTQFGGSAGTFASGRPEVNATHWGGTAVASARPLVDAVQISGDSAAADALELAFDGTAGAVPSFGIVDRGTAQAATATTLQLRSAAAFADDELNGATILITGGSAGVGQRRLITDYVSSTDTATVATWTTTPTGTITYEIYATVAPDGVAQTGDAYARLGAPVGASVSADIAALPTAAQMADQVWDVLPTGTVATDAGNSATSFKTDRTETTTDFWKDALLLITSGVLVGQVKKVAAYNGTTKIITVSGGFTATPADGVTFVLVNR